MGQFVAPTNEAPVDEMHSHSPRKKPAGFSSLGLRTRCIMVEGISQLSKSSSMDTKTCSVKVSKDQ